MTPSAAVQACGAIEGLVDNGNDCDDTNRFMQEQRTIETHYNGIDDNCDISDGDGDADGDGHWAEDYVAQPRAWASSRCRRLRAWGMTATTTTTPFSGCG